MSCTKPHFTYKIWQLYNGFSVYCWSWKVITCTTQLSSSFTFPFALCQLYRCYFGFLIGVMVYSVYMSSLCSWLLYYYKDFCLKFFVSIWLILFFNTFFQFLRDLDDEISAIKLEEESLKRKMNGKFLAYHSARRNWVVQLTRLLWLPLIFWLSNYIHHKTVVNLLMF